MKLSSRVTVCFSIIFLLFSLVSNMAEARSGCCSHHGGVCGCGCCDGTSLSSTCAPYYPECSGRGTAETYAIESKPAPATYIAPVTSPVPTTIPSTKPTPKPSPSPTPTPTPTPSPRPSPTPIPSPSPSPEVKGSATESSTHNGSGGTIALMAGAGGVGYWLAKGKGKKKESENEKKEEIQ